MWLFNRPCNVLLKLKRLNKSSESKTQTQQDALLGVGCSSSALSKELWAWKYWRKQTAEPSCQWSITTTSFDTRHPPPDNTPWQLQTAFRFGIWTEIYHRRSDKLGEAATSLTGLTQSPRFSFTITAMWNREVTIHSGHEVMSHWAAVEGFTQERFSGITFISIWHMNQSQHFRSSTQKCDVCVTHLHWERCLLRWLQVVVRSSFVQGVCHYSQFLSVSCCHLFFLLPLPALQS